MRTITQSLSAIVLVAAVGTIRGTTAGEVELSRVKGEWPAAAQRLDEMFAQVRGRARLWSEGGRSANRFRDDARFAIDHGMEKVDLERFTAGPKRLKLADMAYCGADGSMFRIVRRAGAESYNVQGIGKTDNEWWVYVSTFGRSVHAHHGVMGRPMTSVFGRPGFEITGAEAIDQAGKTLMRVDCVSGPSAAKDQISLVLDPDAGWIVRSCRFRPRYDESDLFRFEVEYGPARGGIPLPRHVKLDTPSGVVDHCEFTDWTFAPTAVSEFNMTHYGLPDLVQAHRPRNTLPYWLAGLGVLIGSIAFVLRRLMSRGSDPARHDAGATAIARRGNTGTRRID